MCMLSVSGTFVWPSGRDLPEDSGFWKSDWGEPDNDGDCVIVMVWASDNLFMERCEDYPHDPPTVGCAMAVSSCHFCPSLSSGSLEGCFCFD